MYVKLGLYLFKFSADIIAYYEKLLRDLYYFSTSINSLNFILKDIFLIIRRFLIHGNANKSLNKSYGISYSSYYGNVFSVLVGLGNKLHSIDVITSNNTNLNYYYFTPDNI
jgi:hypothetical protein